ncbi:hypothetical protein chiPu_0022428 [Chiloscyllium punctatum]|uniref:Uncharacterized protein n=1 Tax=Chiloscyllium punctatum TaxID=137246 RepID=A0A401RE74_CHIPU|nr:hypothetical protein [Chiloscyllium punctatum]
MGVVVLTIAHAIRCSWRPTAGSSHVSAREPQSGGHVVRLELGVGAGFIDPETSLNQQPPSKPGDMGE